MKTDTITVKILPILGFSKGLKPKRLTAGVKESWRLPPITKLSFDLNDVSVQVPEPVADLIDYELNSSVVTIAFSGGDDNKMISNDLIGQSFKLRITLRDSEGLEKVFIQTVILQANSVDKDIEDADTTEVWILALISLVILLLVLPLTYFVMRRYCKPCFKRFVDS